MFFEAAAEAEFSEQIDGKKPGTFINTSAVPSRTARLYSALFFFHFFFHGDSCLIILRFNDENC